MHEHGRLLIAVSGGPSLPIDNGLIPGALFHRYHPGLVETLAPTEQAAIIETGGAHLIDRYWGAYLAFLHDPRDGTIHVMRAPMGECPCFCARTDGAWLFASDLALLTHAGASMAIDWNALARELIWPCLRGGETCLIHVRSLMGGHRISLGADRIEAQLWSPWDHVASAHDRAEAEHIAQVKRAVENCVAARASQFGSLILLLSGGLDSSIVATCLARHDPSPNLLTLFTRDAVGDERDYARAVAALIGLPLLETLRDVANVDPYVSKTALPYPGTRLFEQATRAACAQFAGQSGPQAIFTGGGGDNVFCALQSAAPVADRILSGHGAVGVFKTVRDVSRVAPAAMPSVLVAALKRVLPWRRASPLRPNLAFMSARAFEDAGHRPPPHPWLIPPPRFLPGKSAHITMLTLAQGFAQTQDPLAFPAIVHPLLSQPIVEACLAVPSWLWVSGGMNRAVARQAFACALPEQIVRRRTKGSPQGFVGELFEHHQTRLKAMILDGQLAQRGFLDTKAVKRAFDSAAGRMAPDHVSDLMRIADVEAWLLARKT
ncbi:lasso peptide isopeptide bond-forming cyclase [soil metagenome]